MRSRSLVDYASAWFLRLAAHIPERFADVLSKVDANSPGEVVIGPMSISARAAFAPERPAENTLPPIPNRISRLAGATDTSAVRSVNT